MKTMVNWEVDVDDGAYAVVHYVGGEEGHVLDDYYWDEEHANARAAHLNKQAIQYEWVGDGNSGYNIKVHWEDE